MSVCAGVSEFTVDMTVVITRDQGRGNNADGIITFKVHLLSLLLSKHFTESVLFSAS